MMTTIIALKEKDKIYMASDTQVSRGQLITTAKQKLFKKGKMMFGFAGYSRFGKLLKYGFSIPEQDEKTDDMTYMNTAFVDSLMDFLDKKQFNAKFDSRVNHQQEAMICYNGNIYVMSGDYDVSSYDGDFHCIGSGWELAYGSMNTTELINEACEKLEAVKMEPEHRLRMAVETAIKFNDVTGGDVNILSMSIK